MRRWFWFFLTIGVILYGNGLAQGESEAETEIPVLKPERIHPKLEQVIAGIIKQNHYHNRPVDDSLSSLMFDEYMNMLDYNKSYFLKAQVDQFEKYRYTLDDNILNANVGPAFEMFQAFIVRFVERTDKILGFIDTVDYDFSEQESFRPDREKAPWAMEERELDSLWRKRIKNEALNLKLAGKKKEGIKETLSKRYKNIRKRMIQYENEEVFELYMNAFASVFDPHTSYFSPKSSEDFKIKMSLSFEGIGATLQMDNDYTKVVDIVPGGPADLSGNLHRDDRIIGVGQGKDGEIVDVIGWRLDDVVQLIRGPKETLVRLQVLRAASGLDSSPEIIEILRNKIKLEDRAARGDVFKINNQGKEYRFGIIHIPTFYFDYQSKTEGDEDYKSTTRDVKRLIKELSAQDISGLIIDLRKNTGGFLSEAVDLTGLFIDRGPVVQVRSRGNQLRIERDDDTSFVYKGPLAVCVDEFSASASEIFAAAIQDYQRGIVVGAQTYGKGTVQNVVDLNRVFPNYPEKLGQIKITIAKFYRVNGGSTQHLGVVPNVLLPGRYDHEDVGESAKKNALLWDKIDPLRISAYDSRLPEVLIPIKDRHWARMENIPEFKNYLEKMELFKKYRDKDEYSLNEEERKKEREEAKIKKEELSEEDTEEDTKKEKKDKKDKIEIDPCLKESGYILSDYIILSAS